MMRILKKILPLFLLPFVIVLNGCGDNNEDEKAFQDAYKKQMELHLTFDEEEGTIVHDATKKHKDQAVSYALLESDTLLEKPQDLPWKKGAVGNALLFDGYSTWITYDADDIAIKGSAFSISAWVAPRAYDWDSTDAIETDSENLTGIVSQYYRDQDYSMGFIFGYHREGHFTFQCGLGEQWVEIWDEGSPLAKYAWNHIAATFDGEKGRLCLYLNGKLINIVSVPVGSSIQMPDMPLLVGKNNVSRSSGSCTQSVVSGLLDDIRLYRAVLPHQQIRDYYTYHTVDGRPHEIVFSDIWLQNSLTEDAYKSQFHGGPYEHWMNEPHAPIYYQGIYHLFFQFNILGPYFNNAAGIAWGHLVSPDMVNWKPVKEAIVPTADSVCPDGVWSGGSTYATVDGVDNVPVLLFTAGDYQHAGKLSNQNIGLAVPKDVSDPYLIEWEISNRLAIEQVGGQGAANEFRDAHIFIEDDTYYLLVGSSVPGENRGCALLYTSSLFQNDPLHHWTYRGYVYDYPGQPSDYGTTWELPVLLPLTDEKGNQTEKYVFIISPAPASKADNNIIYWIGTFDKTNYRFVPDWNGQARRMDYGRNVFTGPSAFIDPLTNMSTMFSIMQDQRESSELAASGWAHCVGLPRQLYLGDDGDLHIQPVPTIDSLKQRVFVLENATVEEINQKLTQVTSDMIYIKVCFEHISDQASVGIKTRMTHSQEEYTTYYYDRSRQVIGANTQLNRNNSTLSDGVFEGEMHGTSLVLELFVDRSMIEGFFNNYKTISTRSYTKDLVANQSELFITNGTADITYFEICRMNSIYA